MTSRPRAVRAEGVPARPAINIRPQSALLAPRGRSRYRGRTGRAGDHARSGCRGARAAERRPSTSRRASCARSTSRSVPWCGPRRIGPSPKELGIGTDGDLFWINLGGSKARDRRSRWLQHADFRRAIAHAVDRDQFVNTVYLGAGLPGFGVVSPGNRQWYVDSGAPQFDRRPRRNVCSRRSTSRPHDDVLVDAEAMARQIHNADTTGQHVAGAWGVRRFARAFAPLGIRVDIVPSKLARWFTAS